jgi:hypothetical protein
MATYAYTHYITYLNGSYDSDTEFVGSLSDGEPDTTFETPDPVTDGTNSFTYAGTTVVDGQTWPVLNFVGPPAGYSVVAMTQAPSVIPPTLSVTDEIFDTVCFAEGTLIAGPDGETEVEALRTGDLILAENGTPVPVKWIARQTVHKLFSGPRVQLVRIQAGALGANMPHSPLTVTADHGMIIDGHVVNASALVNGTTIDWVPMAELPDRFTIYHVETEGHDVILANGAPSETFIDYRDRRAFDNYDEYLELYGCERIIPEMAQPRISSARHLPRGLQARLGLADKGASSLQTRARA